jgi:hypothetical protein
MVKTNQGGTGKESLAFGDHQMGISPYPQFKAIAQSGYCRMETGDALLVIFEDEN